MCFILLFLTLWSSWRQTGAASRRVAKARSWPPLRPLRSSLTEFRRSRCARDGRALGHAGAVAAPGAFFSRLSVVVVVVVLSRTCLQLPDSDPAESLRAGREADGGGGSFLKTLIRGWSDSTDSSDSRSD